MHRNGGGVWLTNLYRHIIVKERYSTLGVPFLNEALDSTKDVF